MRAFIALLVIVYRVGVALAPTFKVNWNTASASQLVASVAQDLRERRIGRRRHIAELQSAVEPLWLRLAAAAATGLSVLQQFSPISYLTDA
jgi:hypothetical protein